MSISRLSGEYKAVGFNVGARKHAMFTELSLMWRPIC